MLYMYNITTYLYFFIVTVDQLNGSLLNKVFNYFLFFINKIKTWYNTFHNLLY